MRLGKVIFIILISAVCYFFSTGFYDVWPLVWIAPIPILLFSLYERKIAIIFLAAFLAYFIGGLNILYYATTILPIFGFVIGIFISAFIFAVIVVASRFIIKKSNRWWSVFAFPCLLITFEFIISNFSSAGTVDSLAYTQFKFLPVIQVASITGIWGITFILGLFASAVVTAWYLRKNKKQMLLGLFIPIAIIVFVLGFGGVRLVYSKPIGTVKAGLLAAPLSMHNLFTINSQIAKEGVMSYFRQIPKLKKQGVDIILMPEEIVITKPAYDTQILNLFQKAAKENRIMLAFGFRQLTNGKTKNTAFVISKDGKIIIRYYKHHMVSATEGGFYIGKKTKTFKLNKHLIGIAICKDNDFIYPDLEYSKKGVGSLLVLAWDFGIDRWLHAKPSFMRGVEGGYSVVRVAQDGYLSVTDECGRMLEIKQTSFKKAVFMVVDVPIYAGNTIYSQFGDWFVWLSVIGIFLLIFMALLKRPKNT